MRYGLPATRVTFVFSVASGFLLPADRSALGQWVEFKEKTQELLAIAPINLSDTLEKDIAAGDLNGDGWDDLVVVRKTRFSNPGAQTDILLINEEGVLVNRTEELAPGFLSIPTDARDVFLTDVDLDGWTDVVIANTFEEQPRLYRNRGVDEQGVWLGLADESFRLPHISLAPLQFCAVWAADLTGNKAPDLYFSNYLGRNNDFAFDVLLINDGTGFFTNETRARLTGPLGNYARVAFGTSVEMHDVDNDGDNDIIKISTKTSVAPWNTEGVFVLFNDGAGFFNTRPFQSLGALNSPYMFTVGDLNDDDLYDFFFQGDAEDVYRHAIGVAPNTRITLAAALTVDSPRLAGIGGNVKMMDVDNDGDLDVGVASADVEIENCGERDIEFALLRNDEGMLTDIYARETRLWHTSNFDFSFTDVDRDGLPELFLGNCDGYQIFRQVDVFLRDCNSNDSPDGIDILSGKLDQWADSVLDFSSQRGKDDHSANQALGEPDTIGFGENTTAWSPESENGSVDSLSVGFAAPVFAEGATIRETQGNGFVFQVDAVGVDDVVTTVWTGDDPSAAGEPVGFTVTWPLTAFLVKGLKVHVDTDHDAGWEAIDAVRLHGIHEATSLDEDENSVPDDCECPRPLEPDLLVASNRFLSFQVGDPDKTHAVRVTFVAMPDTHQHLPGTVAWVGEPVAVTELSGENDATPPTMQVAALACSPLFRNWSTAGPVHIYDQNIVPGGTYRIQIIEQGCARILESNFSFPLTAETSAWGDIAGNLDPDSGIWRPPDGRSDIVSDVLAAIEKFGNRPSAPAKVRVDVNPDTPDFIVDIFDISRLLDAFRGLPFPFPPRIDPSDAGVTPCDP